MGQPFWQGRDRLCTLSNLKAGCPPLHIFTGWSDFFLPGALADYRDASAAGADVRLTLGDYAHFEVLSLLKQSVPGLLDWYDAKLAGIAPHRVGKRIHCQLQGSQKWVEMDDFPPQNHPKTFYLRANGLLAHHPAAGGESESSISSRLSYFYNPHDPTPAIGGASFHIRNC